MPAAVLAIVVTEVVAVEVIGAAIAEAIVGATVSAATATAVGTGVVAAGVTLATGGDASDALQSAVTAGVGSVVGGVVSGVVSDAVAANAPEVITNAVSNAAGSAAAAAAVGGDIEQAALMGAATGAGATLGRDIGTAAQYDTTPGSAQTGFLKAQEVGMGGAGSTGANIGIAAGQIAAGREPEQAILDALVRDLREERRATATPVDEAVGAEVETAPASPQEILIPDQISQESALDVLGQPLTPEAAELETVIPEYGVQDLGIDPEAFESFDRNLLEMQQAGQLPSQWVPGDDGTFTYTADDGSTVTVDSGANILDFTEAPAGALLEDVADVSEEAPEEAAEKEPTKAPFVREFTVSSGGRKREPAELFAGGPSSRTLGEVLAAPFAPSSALSGLTSYRGAGEIESQRTGKPRKNVWNEASLRLKDALGL